MRPDVAAVANGHEWFGVLRQLPEQSDQPAIQKRGDLLFHRFGGVDDPASFDGNFANREMDFDRHMDVEQWLQCLVSRLSEKPQARAQ